MKALLFFLALTTAAFAAEPEKPLSDLITERKAVYEEIEQYKKENEKNLAAFNKLPAAVEFNAKQRILTEKWQKAQAKIMELNGQIADKVSKEKK